MPDDSIDACRLFDHAGALDSNSRHSRKEGGLMRQIRLCIPLTVCVLAITSPGFADVSSIMRALNDAQENVDKEPFREIITQQIAMVSDISGPVPTLVTRDMRSGSLPMKEIADLASQRKFNDEKAVLFAVAALAVHYSANPGSTRLTAKDMHSIGKKLEQIKVTCDPSPANVIIDGKRVGKTELVKFVFVPDGESCKIMVTVEINGMATSRTETVRVNADNVFPYTLK